jgi:copper/silver efflux system protein
MIGGLVTSFLRELLVYPAIYELWKRRELPKAEPTVAWTRAPRTPWRDRHRPCSQP